MTPTQPDYLLFTSLVKHGELLSYLLAAQVRKRLMEPYGFHRQVKSSALTGNPDRIFELYHVEEPGDAITDLQLLAKDPTFKASHALIESVRIHSLLTEAERPPQTKHTSMQDVPLPLQKLSQMEYLHETRSRQQCEQLLAKAPYLLQVTCNLLLPDKLNQFIDCMSLLVEVFADSGLNLLIAGQHVGTIKLSYKQDSLEVVETDLADDDPISILNVWEFEDPDSPKLLMAQLAENRTYSELDALCTQDQHICRNVSRHYQRYPLLPGLPLAI